MIETGTKVDIIILKTNIAVQKYMLFLPILLLTKSGSSCIILIVRPTARHKINMGEFPSGQRGQTVNLLLDSFGGSNPPSPTKYDVHRSTSYFHIWTYVMNLCFPLGQSLPATLEISWDRLAVAPDMLK